MNPDEARTQGRAAFARNEWARAQALLSAADDVTPLAAEDLEQLAVASYLIGLDEPSRALWERAHHSFVAVGDGPGAARCGFRLGMSLIATGDVARGGGWLGRAQRILDDEAGDCLERGLLLLPAALQRIAEGDPQAAYELFGQAAEFGERFKDGDLIALSRLGRGRSLIMLSRGVEGFELLDEVMVSVTAGDTSPITSGIVYCAVISICQEMFDLRRAQEWTAALDRWCESQPDLLPYRGQCLVHRAQIMALHGSWTDAIVEAERACVRLSTPRPEPAVGAAYYQIGELHRLLGDFAAADAAYRKASEWRHGPHPGLAQLRLAQGRADVAASAIRVALDEATHPLGRAGLLPAYVEVLLAVGDVPAAAAAAAELATIAASTPGEMLQAHSAYASGAVLLAKGDARTALISLRQACTAWHEAGAPYDEARAGVLVGRACRDLGDVDGWELELEAARRTFAQLGAAPALASVEQLLAADAAVPDSGLTGREVQVLGLVATGRTNKEIAADLVISEKTVARHVSNIFTKLGLSSRSAATAYAYQHDLV